ncbi:MAG: hypothetical protein HY778_01300 [Betaproteobacteria bacterium]|nr:hypothetical protein [Betaproteobacteria bacterium]
MDRQRALKTYRTNEFSQNGEDGVIAELLRRWGIRDGWFCEFGAWDGKYGSNTYSLLRRGWRGVMIESDPSRFRALEQTARKHKQKLHIINALVDHQGTECSLDNLLGRTPIPAEFDVLSIDVDSFDYHIWQSLQRYTPNLVIIEIDSSVPPGESYIYKGGKRLTSFSAMLDLGKSKGYTLVCHTGNMFFARNALVERLGLSEDALGSPETLFIDEWLNPTPIGTFKRKVRNMTWQRLLAKLQNLARG